MADDEPAPPPPRRDSNSESHSTRRPTTRDADSDEDAYVSAGPTPAIGAPGDAPAPRSMFAPPSDGVKSAWDEHKQNKGPPASNEWIEFKGPDGKNLWFNANTKEMKYDGSIGIVKPKPGGSSTAGAGAGAGGKSDDDSEDEAPAGGERRRRSTRRKDSDDDGDDSNDSSEEGRKRAAKKKAAKAAKAAAAGTSPSPNSGPVASAAPIPAPGSTNGLEKKVLAPELETKTRDSTNSVLSPTAAGAKKKKTKTGDEKDDEKEHAGGKDDDAPANAPKDGDEDDDDDVKRIENGIMSIDKIVRSLNLIERHVSVILDKSQNLTPVVCEDLRQILSRVSSVQSSLASKAGIDDRNEVDGLIDYPRVPWTFENNHLVDSYRATAVKWKHDQYRFQNWHFPQYFSASPLPPDIPKEVSANIRLPVPEGMPPKAIPVKISAKDTVLDVMKRARDLAIELDIENHVFKAFGLREFMEGNQLIFSYEYVRQNLRDGKKLELVLCKKPEPLPLPVSLQQNDLTAWYRAKVTAQNDVPFCQPGEFTHLPNPFTTPFDTLRHLPLSSLNQPFRMKVAGLDNVSIDTLPRLDQEGVVFTHLFVEAFVFHGMEKFDSLTFNTTKYELPAQNPRWPEWLTETNNGLGPAASQPAAGGSGLASLFTSVAPGITVAKQPTLLSTLPRETRIAFVVQGVTNEKGKTQPLGWVVRNLVDEYGVLSTGKIELKLWPFPGKKKKGGGHGKVRDLSQNSSFFFRATTRDNLSTENPKGAAVLRVEFPTYALPVVAPLCDEYRAPNLNVVGPEYPLKNLNKKQTKQLETVIEADALYQMTPEDKELVWKIRHHLVKYPLLLPKFLQSVKWQVPDCRHEAHRLLEVWTPPMSHLLALELLDSKYPDYRVREYAVTVLRRLPDDELRLYLLQITQCLKYESYHESPLTRFLMERALMSPYEIGHHLFWHLKAELHSPMFSERYALILEEFLSHAPREAYELRKQNSAVLKLERIATLIVTMKRENGASDAEAMKEYTREVEKLNRDFFMPNGKFQIPYNPKLEATSLIVEKCRYMSSKMVPLWLVFRNADADAPPIYIIFKSGDDLRQDILTLQMLRVMDATWLSNGQDMRMKPYACIATGVNDNHEGVGMIEVVMNSDTTSGIQLKYGGGAVGALKLDPIERFISDHNKPGKEYDHAVDNFVRSCAGYCVATYVLGIGDRHNGNIMVTKGGHLFHIDFGHFLGNFKKKFGVNRERAAFVFTPEMAYVMGGKNYKKSNLFKQFLKLCSEAFKYLRLNSIVLENMFILMVSAGMPELLLEKDINYLRDKLAIGLPEKKADETLHAEINKSLDSTYRRIDNMIHNFKHG